MIKLKISHDRPNSGALSVSWLWLHDPKSLTPSQKSKKGKNESTFYISGMWNTIQLGSRSLCGENPFGFWPDLNLSHNWHWKLNAPKLQTHKFKFICRNLKSIVSSFCRFMKLEVDQKFDWILASVWLIQPLLIKCIKMYCMYQDVSNLAPS